MTDTVIDAGIGESRIGSEGSFDFYGYTTSHKRLVVAFLKEDTGISAIAINLPGVVGCGKDEAEAEADIGNALRAVLKSYADRSVNIPWVDVSKADERLAKREYKGCTIRGIIVNVESAT